MSEEMRSQGDEGSDYGSDYNDDDDMDDDMGDDSYYYDQEGDDTEMEHSKKDDPEYFEYNLLKVEDVERLLNESVEALCKSINVKPALAKMLLYNMKWAVSDIEIKLP